MEEESSSDFDSVSSSEEELECQLVCDFDCEECKEGWCPRNRSCPVEQNSSLDCLALESKIIFLAFIPMLGRHIGSAIAKRLLKSWFGTASY